MGIMRKMNVAGTPEAAAGTMGKVMKFMPLMSVWFGFILPAALSFYWTIGTILQIGQDIWLTKKYTKIIDAEEAEKTEIRKAKEAEIEAKREETERKKAEGLVERNRNTSRRKKQKSSKQGQLEKAVEWEKKNTPVVQAKDKEKDEPGRIDNRRYARGRAYDPDRFINESAKIPNDESDDESVEQANELDNYADEQAEDTVMLLSDDEDITESEDDEYDEEDENGQFDSDEDSASVVDEIEDEDEDEDKDEAEHMEDIENTDEDKNPDTQKSEKFDTKRFD